MSHAPLRRARAILVLALVATLGGCASDVPAAPGGEPDLDPGPDPPDPGPTIELTLTPVVEGLRRPVHLAAPPGDPRLFIVEKAGRVLIAEDGIPRATPFLDLAGSVSEGGEQGLLSVAFHPDYGTNGFFFLDYTDVGGDTRVVRYRVGADPNVADPGSAVPILSIEQPFSNHNGGHLLFGPDGMLYVTVGDGGSGGDPQGNGQNPATRLGSILRIDVDGAEPFDVPPDNPFVGHSSFLPEIWLWGLRNPWRIAFDTSRNLYVADVGQNQWEEVTVVGPGDGGANLGWNVTEGSHCFRDLACTPGDYTLPQVEYSHDEGCSITGGRVYRGSIDEIRGHYFYSDYCGGWLRSFRYADGGVTEPTEWTVPRVGNVTSFGEDADGELYLLTEEAVYRLDEATGP